MTAKTITAFTASEPVYPALVSINDYGERIGIMVRGRKTHDEKTGYDKPGPLAEIRLTHEEFVDLVTACNLYKRGA